MIVELVGASGSGKTALAVALLSTLSDMQPGRRSLGRLSSRRTSSYPIGGLAKIGGLVFVPGTMLRLSRASSQLAKSWRSVSFKQRVKLVALAAGNQGRARLKSVFLYDQGLVQALGCLTRGWPDANKRSAIVELYEGIGRAALPDLIIAVAIDPSLAAIRTKLSGERYRRLDEIERITNSVFQHAEILRERFGVQVTMIHNNADLAAAVKEARAAIASLPLQESSAEFRI